MAESYENIKGISLEKLDYFIPCSDPSVDYSDDILHEMVQFSSDGFISIDYDHKIVGLNKCAEIFFGYVREELIGQPLDILIPEEHRPNHSAHIHYASVKNIVARPMALNRAITGLKRDGTQIPLSIAFMRHPQNSKVQYTAVCRDISERAKREEMLGKALAEAETAIKAKDQFMAIASHELRTPLNAIIGFSELIQKRIHGPIGIPKYEEYCDDIHNGGKHLLSLINEILEAANVKDHSTIISLQSMNLNVVTERIVRSLRTLADTKDIHLHLTVDTQTENIMMDIKIYSQIVLNLLQNAIKFSHPNKNIYVFIMASDKYLKIQIEDQGIGISDDQKITIFNAFTQVEDATNRSNHGLGLGLYIIKDRVQLLGGYLELKSALNIGSIFSVHIPLPVKPLNNVKVNPDTLKGPY